MGKNFHPHPFDKLRTGSNLRPSRGKGLVQSSFSKSFT